MELAHCEIRRRLASSGRIEQRLSVPAPASTMANGDLLVEGGEGGGEGRAGCPPPVKSKPRSGRGLAELPRAIPLQRPAQVTWGEGLARCHQGQVAVAHRAEQLIHLGSPISRCLARVKHHPGHRRSQPA